MTVMRRPISLAAAVLFTSSSVVPAAELVEQIVVRVNDRLITQSEFDKRLAIAARAPNHPTDQAELERNVLEDLIREKLLEERAKEMAVSATDDEVEAAVARVKAQYNLTTDAEFDAALAQSGMTRDELKRQMRQTITLQKVIGRDVTSQLQLTDDQLRLEYERKKDQFYAVPESAHVSEIVMRFSPSDARGPAEGRRPNRGDPGEGQGRDARSRDLAKEVLRGQRRRTRAGTSGSSRRESSSRLSTPRSS